MTATTSPHPLKSSRNAMVAALAALPVPHYRMDVRVEDHEAMADYIKSIGDAMIAHFRDIAWAVSENATINIDRGVFENMLTDFISETRGECLRAAEEEREYQSWPVAAE